MPNRRSKRRFGRRSRRFGRRLGRVEEKLRDWRDWIVDFFKKLWYGPHYRYIQDLNLFQMPRHYLRKHRSAYNYNNY